MDMVKILSSIIESKGRVKFTLYTLNYIIEKKEEKYVIFPELYPGKSTKQYQTLNELLESYQIYNENIIDNIYKITMVE